MVQSKTLRNILLVGLMCLLLALWVWYWTESRMQFYLGNSGNNLEKIGQIKIVNFDALINFSGQLVWQKIDEGDFVFVGNSLQTNQDSSTEIILDDGQQLTIGKNSLVRFIKEDGAVSLQLVEGKLEVKNDPTISELVQAPSKKPFEFFVKTPKGKINTKSTNIKIERKSKDKEEFNFEVLSGKPKILDPKSEVNEIASTKIDMDIKPKEKKPALVDLTEPKIVEKPVTAAPPVQLQTPPQPVVQQPVQAPANPIVDKPVEKVVPRAPAQLPKKKTGQLPKKIPLSAPKIKRVDVKVVE